MRAEAIKIGIVKSTSQTYFGVSTKANLINEKNGKLLHVLEPMKPYRIKSYGNNVAIEVGGQYFDTHTDKVSVVPAEGGFVSTKNRWYRGVLIISSRNNNLTLINDLPLEEYLLGVVPSEMPSGWSFEAHKAQAIAARSYAIANLGKRASLGFDLFDTPEDQAYGGASSESARTTQAVIDTTGIVVTYNQQVIPAYYCASAGGQTNNSGEVWNKDLPFLKSVPSFDDQNKKNGHGVGMSQHGANNLAQKGYNAYQILTYYYNNVKFGKLKQEWTL